MDFGRYEALGRRIDAAWQRADRDERRFPAIACEALTAFEPDGFDLGDIGRFLLDTAIPQQPETRFSNLPVMLYCGDGFYLELLVWTRSTTSLHQHAFSGAFRVVAGSSLHSDYRFVERRRINSHLLVGDIEAIRMRLLRVGDVLPIISGREGLIHSLFHLDQPSATLVARTDQDPDAGPQYALIRPGFAFDSLWADADNRVAIVHRWFGVSADSGDPALAEGLLDRLVELDPARLFAILRAHANRLSEAILQDTFLDKLKARHPELAESLAEIVRIEQREGSLVATRSLINDPDLRFFIALLLNAQSNGQILDMIRARDAQADAEARCVDWLLRIGDPARLGVALRERSPLLLRLGMALGTAGADAPRLVEAIVRGQAFEDAFLEHFRADPRHYQRLLQADRAIRTAPELSALFAR